METQTQFDALLLYKEQTAKEKKLAQTFIHEKMEMRLPDYKVDNSRYECKKLFM